ncbi:MAG: septum formation initiator family protein [Firmicutes bacterium]|nr:septum formation initiator family protein [Bacillota bacterium]MCM1400697.1 septum formation initiator family protein [Bacteroides sp.]MCM1476391.1 septum formation initiator family protein [Bacteroides sp.]
MSGKPRRTFLQWCRRYISASLIVAIGLIVYILFFSGNSVFDTYKYDRQIDALNQAIRETGDSLDYYRTLEQRLNTDPAAMEQVVRENYRMQRPDEDVYVVQ